VSKKNKLSEGLSEVESLFTKLEALR